MESLDSVLSHLGPAKCDCSSGLAREKTKVQVKCCRYTFNIFTIKTDYTGFFPLNFFSVHGPREQIKEKSKDASLSSLQELGPQIPISWALLPLAVNIMG